MNNITTLSQKKASELKIGDEVANMGVVLGYRHNDPVITVKFRTNEGEDILKKIGNVATGFQDRPVEDVVMTKVTINH